MGLKVMPPESSISVGDAVGSAVYVYLWINQGKR